ncbi:MAG: serine/threonine-protein kinase, partial [Planctomycetota bacterium]
MSDRWQQLPDLFHRARGLPAEDRPAFLDEVCAGDVELRERLEKLLKATKQNFDESELGGKASGELLGSVTHGAIPDAIGQYRLLEPVGSGGMGTVYRAEQEQPKRVVAVKVMSSPFSTEAARQRFSYEVEVLGRLQHAGIAAIHDAGTFETSIGDQPFFVMEYVEGVDLLKHVTDRSFSLRERIVLAIQICDAVHHAHQNGVVHRDLKPANILVDASGRPKVLDFGIARVADRAGATEGYRTQTGQIVGTMGYMSPEQAAGLRAVDARSDVYSLGVILYQLISGKLPHPTDDRSVPELLHAIAEQDPPSLGTVAVEAKGDLEVIVGKALEREPERRYPSASEFGADLRRFLDDEPISARPPSAVYQVTKFAKRNRQLVTGVSVGLLLLVAGLVFAVAGYVEADDARETAVDRATEADRVIALFSQVFAAVKEQGRDARVIDALDATRLKLDSSTSESPAIRARMKQVLAAGYAYLGEPTVAEELLDEAIAVFPEDDDPKKYWEMQFDRTLFLGRAGRVEEAMPILVEVIDRFRGWYGDRDEQTLAAELRRAEFLGESGSHPEAEKLLRRILDRGVRAYGPDHELIESVEHTLAGTLSYLNRSDEAIALLESIVNTRRNRDGAFSLETLASVQVLGAAYLRQGEYQKSLDIFNEAWELQKKYYGKEHPSALTVQASIATVLSNCGHMEEAEAMTREVLDARMRKLG